MFFLTPFSEHILNSRSSKKVMGNCIRRYMLHPPTSQATQPPGDSYLPELIPQETTMQVASVRVRALYNYIIHNPGDLAFCKGDIMVVSSDLNEPWWFATHQVTFKTGYIPSNYVAVDDGSPTSHEAWFEINHSEADRKLLLMGNPKGTFIIRPCSGNTPPHSLYSDYPLSCCHQCHCHE